MEINLLKVDESATDEIFEIEKNILSRLTSSNLITKPEIIKYYFSQGDTYLIKVNNQTAGVVAIQEKEDEIELTSILIKKMYQGQGIGTKVLQQIFKMLITSNKKWTVITHPENHHSIRLYWKFGFELSDWLGDYFGVGEPRIKMTKKS
jgi:ribosomal protein S18 acetylase RimI-like enzyme